jgi:outer membrane protein
MKTIAFVCLWLGFCGFALATSTNNAQPLTLAQAHEAALRNHPRIAVAQLRALAARQVTRQVQAGYFPTATANVVAVGAEDANTRLAAGGGLNNPSVFERNAEGLTITQMITDFGRTANLAGSAKLHAQAEEENTQATREQILLEVDASYYAALQAQSVTLVGEQTVATRQILLEQVSAMASNHLRSDLDVSFAQVSVDEARLLLSRAQNDLRSAYAQLSNLTGLPQKENYVLSEEPLPMDVATNVSEYVEAALRSRPDLLRLREEHESAMSFAKAEKALHYPTLSASASVGVIPIGDRQLPNNYAAAGLNLSLPLYAGGQFTARQKEAALRAQATAESVREQENNVIRDVHISWLNAQNAWDRYRITGRLLDNANLSFTLAEARYTNNLSSIVELNQAQLSKTAAEISYANTKYEYLLRRSALDFQTGSLR